MEYASLDDIFYSFSKQKILVIGDVMLDSYVWGKVDRISPEAPVPVVQVKKKEKRLGGAANVAKNIVALGAQPILCSVIGDDLEGRYVIDLMQEREISGAGIILSNSRITTVKERFLSGSQHILRVDEEQSHELSKKERSELKKKIKALLPNIHAVVIEDYDKGVLDRDVIKFIISNANVLNIPSIVDPKRKNFYAYKNATLFKPNLKEIREGMKIDLDMDDMEGLKNTVENLKTKLEIENVMVTLSDKGIFFSSDHHDYHIPAHVRSISDVSGAGDTVVSIAALCMSLKLHPKFTAALSNLGGGLVCEHLGVVSVDKSELLREAKLNNLFNI